MKKVGEPSPIKDRPGWVWDTYEKSPKLSTYGIAFAVMPDYVAVDTPEGLYRVPIKVTH